MVVAGVGVRQLHLPRQKGGGGAKAGGGAQAAGCSRLDRSHANNATSNRLSHLLHTLTTRKYRQVFSKCSKYHHQSESDLVFSGNRKNLKVYLVCITVLWVLKLCKIEF